jgi:hypothetical protein
MTTGTDYARQARATMDERDARIAQLLNLWRLYGFDLYSWDGQIGHSRIVIRWRCPDGHLDQHRHITGYFDNTFTEWIYVMKSPLAVGRHEYSLHTPAAGSMPDA